MSRTLMDRAGGIVHAEEMIGEDESHFWADASENGMLVDLVWEEFLDFHLDHYLPMVEPLVDVEREWMLTDRGEAAMVQAIRQCFEEKGLRELGAQISVDRTGGGSDGPSFAVIANLELPDGPATSFGTLAEMSWPFYATMTNITDPGTFGSDYVFRLAGEIFEGMGGGDDA